MRETEIKTKAANKRTINTKTSTFKNPIFWLLAAALLIEIANIALTWSLGYEQRNTCPKSPIPGQLSVYLGVISLLLVILTVFLAKKKSLAVVILILWTISLAVFGWVMQFLAVGGLDWCAYLGR